MVRCPQPLRPSATESLFQPVEDLTHRRLAITREARVLAEPVQEAPRLQVRRRAAPLVAPPDRLGVR